MGSARQTWPPLEPARFKQLKRLKFKPRLTEIEDVSQTERKVKMMHFTLDAA
jgi:hypothetical protein